MVDVDPNDMIAPGNTFEQKTTKKLRARLTDKSSAEEDFINEMTRKFLVEWCHYHTQNSRLPWAPGDHSPMRVYVAFAQAKGWISSDETKILAAGWKTAASYLRR